MEHSGQGGVQELENEKWNLTKEVKPTRKKTETKLKEGLLCSLKMYIVSMVLRKTYL